MTVPDRLRSAIANTTSHRALHLYLGYTAQTESASSAHRPIAARLTEEDAGPRAQPAVYVSATTKSARTLALFPKTLPRVLEGLVLVRATTLSAPVHLEHVPTGTNALILLTVTARRLALTTSARPGRLPAASRITASAELCRDAILAQINVTQSENRLANFHQSAINNTLSSAM